jgi:menaquinone-dependent protoporphyrinogen oxidase
MERADGKGSGQTGHRALIAYGTKYGTTSKVAEKIANSLEANGIQTTVLDLRKAKGSNVDSYDTVVIGSSIIMDKWSKGALEFLDHNRVVLSRKKVALFACSGNMYTNPQKIDLYRKIYLDDIAARFGMGDSIPKALFGGEIDFRRYGILTRAIVNSVWRDTLNGLREKGIDLSKPFDFRDWNAIGRWAESLSTGAVE